MNTTKSTDVLIVGGGPAGLAAALAFRQRGATVTLADTRKPPIDKACGEGLMPDSLHDLARLGVHLEPADGAPFHGIRFAEHRQDGLTGREDRTNSVATAEFPDGVGVGVKRLALHRGLVRQAKEAGVQLRWQTTVQLREGAAAQLAGESAKYGWLIGADGHSSRVRRWAGLESGRILSRRFGFRQHFRIEPWSPYVEVHWGRSGQAYVTPVGSDEVCVATIARDPHSRLQTILAEIPWLQAKLAGKAWTATEPAEANNTDQERGALTTTRRLHRVAVANAKQGRVALIGDASGSADAITGEGMGMAFRQALLLAECAVCERTESEGVARYNRLHPGILTLPQTMAQVMLWMDQSAAFRQRALYMLASEPTLFARMLGVHLGAESLLSFVTRRGLEVVWRLAVQGPHTASPIPAA